MLDLEFLARVKTLAIIAMFSDDDLMERLVLKGGNVLDIVHNISTRASLDLDFSIDGDFEDLDATKETIRRVIKSTFSAEGLVAFDIDIRSAPPRISDEFKDFWGGYKLEFKLIEKGEYDRLRDNLRVMRTSALPIGKLKVAGKTPSRKFAIDLSRHEYCEPRKSCILDEYKIYVYSPEMLVAEKIRAVCQQMPEYSEKMGSHASARARDFVDIHVAVEHFDIDFRDQDFRRIITKMFEAKRVPLMLIEKIAAQREFHRSDFVAVRDTVKPGKELRDYDFYFDFVVKQCRWLESLWNV